MHLLDLDQPRADQGGQLGGERARCALGMARSRTWPLAGADGLDLGDRGELGQRLGDGLGAAGRARCTAMAL